MLGCTNSLMDKEYGSFFMLKHSPEMKYFSHFPQSQHLRVHVFPQPFGCSGFPVFLILVPFMLHTPPFLFEEEQGRGGPQEVCMEGLNVP